MPPSVLRVRTCSLTRDQRAGRRVEDAVRGGDAAEPVADVAAGVADALDLGVLAVRVGDLQVAGLDLAAQAVRVEQRLLRSARSSSRPAAPASSAITKSAPWSQERLAPGPGRPCRAAGRAGTALRSLAVMSGFCSEPDSANSFSMILRVRTNQEWSYPAMSSVVRRCSQRAEGVVAGQARVGQPAAERVEPHRGRAGQDADAVAGPDRVPVLDALGVVPHAVAVDQAGAGLAR